MIHWLLCSASISLMTGMLSLSVCLLTDTIIFEATEKSYISPYFIHITLTSATIAFVISSKLFWTNRDDDLSILGATTIYDLKDAPELKELDKEFRETCAQLKIKPNFSEKDLDKIIAQIDSIKCDSVQITSQGSFVVDKK